MKLLYPLFKKIAFSFDPEVIHEYSIRVLSDYPLLSELFDQKVSASENDKYEVSLNGPSWSFPVGLAAGLDKNALALDFFSRLYFGAIEVGTVTPKPQDGNPKPRLFRYPETESLRNKMGFNNGGAEKVLSHLLSSTKNNKVLGVNLGKNKITPIDKAWEDYNILYRNFSKISDYLVINVSSPNTPGLRGLQESDALEEILSSLGQLRREDPCPLYLKISPDIDKTHASAIINLAKKYSLTGIIATNTTIMKEKGEGGISGKLCLEKSRNVRKWILDEARECPDLDVIGVGGISSFKDLWDFWLAGGKAVQIYTAFIYQGPNILNQIKDGIDDVLTSNGIKSVNELLENLEKVKNPFKK